MKVGIITFHRSINYGAFMQCYSLSNRIKKDFPNVQVEVVDYTLKNALVNYINEIKSCKCLWRKQNLIDRKEAFANCCENLSLSKDRIEDNDIQEIANILNSNYDIVIVGSDAVWNWVTRGFPNIYFLKDYKGKKLSYAASAHGMDFLKMTDKQKTYLKDALNDFDYIGVRDITTEKMVNYVDKDLKVNHNCDPTAFLDINQVPCDMVTLKQKLVSRGVDFSKPLIGLMARDQIGREIKRKYGDKVQLIGIYEPNKYADVHLYDLTPFEWAHVFSFFKLTITHFFHGTMLSLVNGVPVIPIEFTSDFSEKHTTKIKDVLTRLELLEWREERDYRNRSFLQKVLMKLKLKTDKKLWNNVFCKIDDMLISDYKNAIVEKIAKESENYNTFYIALQEVIKKLDKEKRK